MTTKSQIPRRVTEPEKINYIILDKGRFSELMRNFSAALKKHTNHTHSISISVSGFDGSFKSVEDFVDTLSTTEWRALSTIRVHFYDIEESSYSSRLSLRFGSYSSSGPGLKIEYGSVGTDVERLAIKESIDAFIADYTRKVPLNDRILPIITSLLCYIGLVAFIYLNISQESYRQGLTLWNHINILSGLAVPAFVTYILTAFIHHKIIPHFETADTPSDVRTKKVWIWIVSIGVILGILSGFVSIAQIIFGNP